MVHGPVTFTIPYTRCLDEAGRAVGLLPGFAQEPGALQALYRAMVLTRRFDAKAVALQRTGRLGTYASSLGQEAVPVGIAAAMTPDDVLVPSYRETGAMLARGVTPEELLLYWGGDERGMDFQGPREDFPISVPVGSHGLHAVGVAYAFKLRRQRRVALAVMGDGASSKGDFYEAINCAGVWDLPVVFVLTDNRWAISVPRAAQSAAETLAQKAVAAGIPGEQVDGNDVIAVRHVVGEAVARARGGGGPTLVEALTYRLTDHTTADDASRYRPEEEVKAAWAREPIARLRNHMVEAGLWAKADEEGLIGEIGGRVDAAVEAYEKIAAQAPEAMFDFVHAELPAAWREQRAQMEAAAAAGGGHG